MLSSYKSVAQDGKDSIREKRKNLAVKEINTYANSKKQWLDHFTVWDENGLKVEEIEYAVYGQRERVTFEYDEDGKCIRENVYNDKNKLYRIRKYEYLPDGQKKAQYNYNPDGNRFDCIRSIAGVAYRLDRKSTINLSVIYNREINVEKP
jgi:antitoxin component YwqK of YwqJK toxin-antitoxin module